MREPRHGVEEPRDRPPHTSASAHPQPVPQENQRDGGAERHSDDPRELDACAIVNAVDEQEQRGAERGGREDRVLEGAEPQYTDARLARVEPGILERVAIYDEAAADDEDSEAGRDDRPRPSEPEPRAALRARNLAVGDDVAEIGGHLHTERDRQPDRVDALQLVQHRLEARGPGDADGRAEGEPGADQDEQGVLGRVPLEMRRRS